MVANGLLVTADVQDHRLIRGSWYHGPCFGQRWPLDALPDADQSAEIVALNAEVYQHFGGWENSVAVVPDLSLVRNYIRVCNTRNIGTRVLLLSSEHAAGVEELCFPRMSDIDNLYLARYIREFGYDYCGPWLDCSIVEMDINDGRFPKLSAIKSRLNQYGMFETVSDLSDFIRARREVQSQSNDALENDDGCAIFRVQEIVQAALIQPE